MSTPRGQIVNRSALLREVETDVAALVESVSDMDDLAVQFDGTEAGRRFVEAWTRAAGTRRQRRRLPRRQSRKSEPLNQLRRVSNGAPFFSRHRHGDHCVAPREL